MKIWITVSCGECAARAKFLARTSDPALARQVLLGLRQNQVLEADRNDRMIGVPDFMAVAESVLALLTTEIRDEACRHPPSEVMDDEQRDPSRPED